MPATIGFHRAAPVALKSMLKRYVNPITTSAPSGDTASQRRPGGAPGANSMRSAPIAASP